MTLFDYAVLLLYLAGTAFIGVLFHKQSSVDDYFLGNRQIPWLASSATLIATAISCVTFISIPGQSFRSDLTFLQVYLSYPIAAIVASFVFLPFYHRLNVITAYEYLERRFDLKSRLLASALFQLFQILVLGTIMAAPAVVISETSDISFTTAVVIIGIVTTLYTMVGGVKAVVWTDVFQLLLLLGAPILALILILNRLDGGLTQVYQTSQAAHKLKVIDWRLGAELTIWATLTSLFLRDLAGYGANQVIVQKYLTTKSIKECRKAMIFNGFSNLLIWSLFFLIGLALYAFHAQYPRRLPAVQPDRVFVRFIVNELPSGIRGLVVAGALAAAMSTISSTLNSLCAASLVDFYNRAFGGDADNVGLQIRRSRQLTLIWGILAIGAALLVLRWGTIVEAGVKIGSFLSGSLLGLFLLGIFSRRAVGTAACAAVVASFLAVVATAQFTTLSYVWYTGIGVAVCLVCGEILSLSFFPPPRKDQLQGLIYNSTPSIDAK